MLIIIDLSEGGETIVGGDDKEELQLVEEAKKREAYLEWVRRNQVVLPQVVPVTDP